ncbi:zinc finger, CCHC-type containing protein [Tanacetum coccineum]
MRYLAFGRNLEEIHVTWAHLEKKRTRIQTNAKTLKDLCSQSLETASQAIHDAVTTHKVKASQHFETASAHTDSHADLEDSTYDGVMTKMRHRRVVFLIYTIDKQFMEQMRFDDSFETNMDMMVEWMTDCIKVVMDNEVVSCADLQQMQVDLDCVHAEDRLHLHVVHVVQDMHEADQSWNICKSFTSLTSVTNLLHSGGRLELVKSPSKGELLNRLVKGTCYRRKLRNKNANKSWEIIENLALYDHEGWDDTKEFVKPVKAIATPQGILTTPDRRLLELEDQINFLLKGPRPVALSSSTHNPQAYVNAAYSISHLKNQNESPILNSFAFRERTGPTPQPQALETTFEARRREERSDKTNETLDNTVKPTRTETGIPVKEAERNNKSENKPIEKAEKEEVVEAPSSRLVEYYLKHRINEKLIMGLIDNPGSTTQEPELENTGGLKNVNALIDQGFDVNVMPCSTYMKLMDERPAETDIKLSLASHSYIYPLGIAEDVLVEVAEHIYPIDFVILDIKEDEKRPFILGVPFVTMVNVVIKFDKGTITLRSGKSKISFYRIPEPLCKTERAVKNDTEPISPTMTVNRLVLEWEERIRLHQEKEMEFDQRRSENFKNEHPALTKVDEEVEDEGKVTLYLTREEAWKIFRSFSVDDLVWTIKAHLLEDKQIPSVGVFDEDDTGHAGIVELSSSTRVEPSPSTPNPVRIIPGPAGIVQQAKLLKERDILLGWDGAVTSTQEYMQIVVEDVDKDDDFKSVPKGKLDQVVAIVKSCSPNVLGDLTVTMKDLSGTIPGTIHYKVISEGAYRKDITVGAAMILANVSVFSSKPSMHYLNITKRNVVKVFRKDMVP